LVPLAFVRGQYNFLKMHGLMKEKIWHEFFEWGIFLKGIYGFFEALVGLSLLFISKIILLDAFFFLAKGELLEDPNDSFLNAIYGFLQHLPFDTKLFIALYILFHGLVKIFLAVMLYWEKLWAYPVAIGFEILFIAYQIYRFIGNHSYLLAAFILIDVVFLIIIWHEYRYKLSLRHEQT
jgi:uncharacterized membrane protein